MTKEHKLMDSLGISLSADGQAISSNNNNDKDQDVEPELMTEEAGYDVVANPIANSASWSELPKNPDNNANAMNAAADKQKEADDLDALEELVPDIKNRRSSNPHNPEEYEVDVDAIIAGAPPPMSGEGGSKQQPMDKRHSMAESSSSNHNRPLSAAPPTTTDMNMQMNMKRIDSLRVQSSGDNLGGSGGLGGGGGDNQPSRVIEEGGYGEASSSQNDGDDVELYEGLDGTESDAPAPGGENSPTQEGGGGVGGVVGGDAESKIPKEFLNMSSGQSLSTATQTHEVRMPMYLPTFKPATGCTNASDFIVRCFVARLRSGITVVKHGRSRWCKSRLRILHIHPDGCSLSWKPAEGEPTSNRRPPKLDLTQCLEVRHAWSPDPQNPMYTGTPILRQKCEAANAHKSFALIFPKRTVDITAVTADQCKVLMEGFSALCFRLQVADLAGKGAGGGGSKKGAPAGARGMPEEDGVSTTASVTLTNTSTPKAR